MDYHKAQEEIESSRQRLFRKMIEIAEQQIRLDQELSRVMRELVGLDQMRAGTEVASGRRNPPPPRVPGLKEHIRKVLSETRIPLTAAEIRDACEGAGITASSRRNLLMSVYTTLKRMHLEIKILRSGDRLTYFPRRTLRASPKGAKIESVAGTYSSSTP